MSWRCLSFLWNRQLQKKKKPRLFTTVLFENDLFELVPDTAPGYFVVNVPDPKNVFWPPPPKPVSKHNAPATTDLKTHTVTPAWTPVEKPHSVWWRASCTLYVMYFPQSSEVCTWARWAQGDVGVKGDDMIGMTFNLGGGASRWCGGEWVDGEGVGLAVNTWHGTQPGRLMVLTASAQWLGIRGCNWVEPKYGHSRQLLIAGANHTLPSLPRFQLFATSGKDTWILLCAGEAALRFCSWLLVWCLKRKSNINYFKPLWKRNHLLSTLRRMTSTSNIFKEKPLYYLKCFSYWLTFCEGAHNLISNTARRI